MKTCKEQQLWFACRCCVKWTIEREKGWNCFALSHSNASLHREDVKIKVPITSWHPVSPTFAFDLLIASLLLSVLPPKADTNSLRRVSQMKTNYQQMTWRVRWLSVIAVTASLLKCRSPERCSAIYLSLVIIPSNSALSKFMFTRCQRWHCN